MRLFIAYLNSQYLLYLNILELKRGLTVGLILQDPGNELYQKSLEVTSKVFLMLFPLESYSVSDMVLYYEFFCRFDAGVLLAILAID